MTDSPSWLINELFAPMLTLVDELSQAANETEAVESFGCDKHDHWCRIGKALEDFDASHLSGSDLADVIRAVKAAYKGTRTQCNSYPDVAIYLFHRRQPLKQLARRGWTAAKQGGTIPDDPFPISLKSSERKAYYAYGRAESKAGRRLQDREAYDLLKEEGIPDEASDSNELQDYSMPSFETWCRYLRTARKALGEQKHSPREGRATGKSVVRQKDI